MQESIILRSQAVRIPRQYRFDVDEVFEDVDFFAEVVFFAVEEEAAPVTDRKALYTFAPLVTLDGSLPLSSVITITSCLLASWNPIR